MEKIMEIKSILIKDTTREERIRIVQEGLNQCGGACQCFRKRLAIISGYSKI